MTTVRRMTKTEMRKLAQESTSYGYYDHGATLSVKCPLCKCDVVTSYSMWAMDDKGRYMTKVAQLRAAVLDHLVWEHGMIGA